MHLDSIRRLIAVAVAVPALILAASPMAAVATADGLGCCVSAGQALTVEESSYKLWPSGAKTVVDVVWLPTDSRASFEIINSGGATTQPATATVTVDYHDPLTQIPMTSTTYSVAVPALGPQTTTTVTVPLDYAQCDVFITIDLGAGNPTVLRTGNPAAC
jgi:hypothetical protein